MERLRQRNISKEQIEQCIQKPDKIENIENNYKCIKRLDNQVLIAVYRKSNEIFTVITAFKTSKTKKYLP